MQTSHNPPQATTKTGDVGTSHAPTVDVGTPHAPTVDVGTPPTPILAELRDYHLPPPVSWWPPAPGWWFVALMLIGLITITLVGWYRRKRRLAAFTQAKAELFALQVDFSARGDSSGFVRGISRLLRRFALVRFPHSQVAGLTGESWLKFLDTNGGDGKFCGTIGRLLLDMPYVPPDASTNKPYLELASLVETWLYKQRQPHS